MGSLWRVPVTPVIIPGPMSTMSPMAIYCRLPTLRARATGLAAKGGPLMSREPAEPTGPFDTLANDRLASLHLRRAATRVRGLRLTR